LILKMSMDSALEVPVHPKSAMSEVEGDWVDVSDFAPVPNPGSAVCIDSFEEVEEVNRILSEDALDSAATPVVRPLEQSYLSNFNIVENGGQGCEDVELLLQQVQIMQHGISCLHSLLSENGVVKHSLETVPAECNPSSSALLGDTSILPSTTAQQLKQVIESTQSLCSMVLNRWQYPRLSFMNFKIGDIALFMPALIDQNKIWMAFNSGAPNYFLADDSLNVFLSKSKNRERTSIIGRIIFLEKKKAESNNAYRIPAGVEYHLCFAEPLYRNEIFRNEKKATQASAETK